MTFHPLSLTLALIFAILAGCQSVPPPPVSEAKPSLTADSVLIGDQGYFPLAQNDHSFLVFFLTFGLPDQVQSWTLTWKNWAGTPVYTIQGSPPFLPKALTWDGRAADGSVVRPGTYFAELTVNYGPGVQTNAAQSAAFNVNPGNPAAIDSFSIPVSDTYSSSDDLE